MNRQSGRIPRSVADLVVKLVTHRNWPVPTIEPAPVGVNDEEPMVTLVVDENRMVEEDLPNLIREAEHWARYGRCPIYFNHHVGSTCRLCGQKD